MSTQQDRVKKQRMNVILDDPFFGSLLMRLKTEYTESIPTAATDGVKLLVNEKFVETLDDEELRGLLIHEILHCALNHQFRRGHRDPRAWNRAADFAINNELDNYRNNAPNRANFKLPDGGLMDHQYDNMAAEEIYGIMPPPPPSGGQSGDGSGDGDGDGDREAMSCGEILDHPDKGDPAKQAEAEADMKTAVIQAANIAKSQGKLPASIERMVDGIKTPKLPWREVLRQFVTEKSNDDYSWAKPNRRFIHQGLVLPSMDGERCGPLVVGVDTSGSINEELLGQFLGEINGIMDDVSPSSVHVVYCDAQVNHVDEYHAGDHIEPHPCGGGGTRFEPVFDFAKDLEETPEAVIYFTDMYGSFPEDPGIPTLWASYSSENKAPFGEVINVN